MKNILVVVGLFLALFIIVISNFGGNEVVYDCRDAHWHPDVPVEVKKECAKLMKEEFERRQRERELNKKSIVI